MSAAPPRPWMRRALAWSAAAGLVERRVADPRWPGRDLRIAVLADLHAAAPWVTGEAVGQLAQAVTALVPDLIVLPGDFLASRWLPGRALPAAEIVEALTPLSAPLGVFAVLGNHDWKDCPLARTTAQARNSMREALAGSAIALLENHAVRLDHGGAFWLVGFDSQRPARSRLTPGRHDPDAAFAEVPEAAPAILLAHEPDYFAEGDPRAFLQISGHTHGGQANLLGWRPLTPSRHGGRYAWGHKREAGRHLIVSGGIGYTGVPLRLFQPPEITLVSLTGRV